MLGARVTSHQSIALTNSMRENVYRILSVYVVSRLSILCLCLCLVYVYVYLCLCVSPTSTNAKCYYTDPVVSSLVRDLPVHAAIVFCSSF